MISKRRKLWWGGQGLSGLVSLVFILSGVFKLTGGLALAEGMRHLGIPESMVVPLALIESLSAVLYLIPATSVLGTILLGGYMGGAICTHWRAGDPFILQITLGILIWLGLYLREERLRRLLPLRTPPAEP